MNNLQNILQGYKATALGIVPQEWEVKRLGEICTYFKSGEGITSKDISENGQYPVYGGNGLRGYTDKKYTHDGAYILIGRQGALCGNINYVKGKCYISEHAIAVQTKGDLSWLRYKLDFWNLNKYSESSAQPGLSVEKLVRYKLTVPPLAEQRKIAEVLGVWDEAIEKQARLIEKLVLRKRGLIQRLLSAKLRLHGFSEKWEEVELGEVLLYEQPTPYIVRDTNYQNNYKTPVLTAGKTFILGYTNEENGICKNIPVILFDDFTTDSRYIDFEFKVKSSATKLLRAKGQNNLYFIFCALQCFKYPIGGHERHWISKFQYLTIALPTIEEQTAIAKVLTAADREIELAKKKLEHLRCQKRGLMQQLLNGKKRVYHE